jgi:hypothetical protein
LAAPSSDVVTQPRPSAAEEDVDFDQRVTGRPPPKEEAAAPPPLPRAPSTGEVPSANEVVVQAPPSPEPAPTLQVGDMVVKPRRVEPQILLKDNVGEFIAEVERTQPATFGEVLDASLSLGSE